MLKLITVENDASMAANVGGDVHRTTRTWEMSQAQELEVWLREPIKKGWSYTERQVIGVEVYPAPKRLP